jgi:hypothetical protein
MNAFSHIAANTNYHLAGLVVYLPKIDKAHDDYVMPCNWCMTDFGLHLGLRDE